jgi:1,4-dihydroxy-2-naphthoate octaprenyltransferase
MRSTTKDVQLVVGAGSVRPHSAMAWVLAARPKTLSAAAVPVAVGTACAYAVGGARAWPALGALAGALLIQIGTNFANDVFDHEKGADREDRVGPLRVVQAGLLPARAVRRAMVATFALAVLVGAYLAWLGGPAIVAVGVLSIASGIAYTGGPYPLGYHGLGDVFVFVFFGLVAVCGTAFVQLGAVPPLAVGAALPVGALATAILVVNNVRDRDTDVLAGKRTLAVRFGRRTATFEYALLLVASYAAPPVMVGLGLCGPWALLPLASAPLAVVLLRRLAIREGTALNPVLAATAGLLLVFGALLSVGLVLGAPS